MKPSRLTLIIATVAALLATMGGAYWLEAGEVAKKKPYPKATPPPEPSDVFAPSDERMPTEEEIDKAAEQHNAMTALEIERSLLSRDATQRETAFTFLLPELLQLEPGLAVDMFERLQGEPRDILRYEMARQWITRDRDAAIAWMKSIENEAERRNAAQNAVDSLAAYAPDQAIYVADQFGIGRDDGYVPRLVQLWAEDDLAEVERWMATQPDNPHTAELRARVERVRESHARREAGSETL